MSSRERPKGIMTKDSVSLLPCFYFVEIMIGEGILFCCHSRRKNGVGAEADINAAGCNFNSFIRRVVRFVGVHVFGLCATALITDIIQLATGYHAPYFLTVCKPNYTTLNLTCDQNSYILDDICSGADLTIINQGRKSFPSQHATLASFAAVYVSMYFNSTLTDSSKLLKPLLVFSFIMCGIICGLTRIIQYKNHAIDVYLGFLLGGGIAVYLGMYAVGNFQPNEEICCPPPPPPQRPTCTLPHISQEAGRHLQAKGLSASHSEGILHRNLHHCPNDPAGSLKRSSAGAEAISPRGLPSQDSLVTFSHTLPRAHTPATLEEAARRSAAIHATMDSSRSKQLLSQWKSKNEGRKASLQSPHASDSCSSSEMGGQLPPPHLYHHGSMELRSCPDPSAMGLGMNGGDHLYPHPYLAAGSSNTLPSNCSGLTGGARMSMQSRPGSSQLVHIPEETHETFNSSSPRSASTTGEDVAANSSARDNWMKAAEKSGAPSRANGGGPGQPRIMQVIAMSKQQGLLHSKSLDESSIGCEGSCQAGSGPGRYRSLTDQDPPSAPASTLGSAVGSISGSTGAIVRVEAHPENHLPLVQAPSVDGSGSWRWRSQDGGGGGGGCSVRQSFELNDLNRDSESSELARDGTIDRKRVTVHNPHSANSTPVPTQSQHPGDPRLQAQPITTIRVTPVEGSGVGGGGGVGYAASDSAPSVASSRDSTLRRKGNNIILIPERGTSPDTTRNIFYKGTSSTPAFKE
ncbi:phospholipid phosphatase-related protein type 4 isoform X2 [Hypomesus transpacificus]|uniref:phospholipid phosphatase-related protein type 4 isoform X2 n=1 Tax=Hypomesus transpacificus TaxID=137520 RepID=UPI001F07666F|nr:phospholipid phosphatase-related protein type 4 isoform X2 [Hypomesus transpacificus]